MSKLLYLARKRTKRDRDIAEILAGVRKLLKVQETVDRNQLKLLAILLGQRKPNVHE